jgi:hypothetical protein
MKSGRCLAGLATVALTGGLLTACGSSTSSATRPTTRGRVSICEQVSAALSNGPDPQADPVGYALAGVIPLGQLATSATGSLRGAIENLASADQAFVKANGAGSSVAGAVKKASDRINQLCPGAAS